AGTEVTGHEFHRTTVTPGSGAAGVGSGDVGAGTSGAAAAWTWADRVEGFATPTLHASYLHTHWAGHPAMAARFAAEVARVARTHDAQGRRDAMRSTG
ncbi:MAG: cobyrinic acid a,c-diamide synthase, partial [Dietzia psychralcaliphila]